MTDTIRGGSQKPGTASKPSYFCYWGKARADAKEAGPTYHPLPYHCLDVAAVGEALWQHHAGIRQRLCDMLDIPETVAKRLLLFFLALHDLGKFAQAFQSLQGEVACELTGLAPRLSYQNDFRHDRLGLWLWEDELIDIALREDWFGVGDDGGYPLQEALGYWAAAATCHHGSPRPLPGDDHQLKQHFTDMDRAAALAWCRFTHDFFGPISLAGIDPGKFESACRRASWLLAGIATLADWIGSNASPDYFVYCDQVVDDDAGLRDYWTRACQIAERAISDFGVLPQQIAIQKDFHDLFPDIAQASPLQALAQKMAKGRAPCLYLIEDVTGAGKTEAALVLAHQMMVAGAAYGLYIGLPTMATSNPMFERQAPGYRRLFTTDSQPSIALAHGARHLSDAFRRIIGRDFTAAAFPNQREDFRNADEGSATAHCNAWIADSRKKTFFADVGVGTLDQALLAVLPAKHQAMRLLGLSQRVLVADEIHAYDDYTGKLLETLLTFQAALGGSAVLLSATLPHKARERLIAAFRKGLGVENEAPESHDYPLLTRVTATEVDEYRVDTRADVARRVDVRPLHEVESATQRLQDAVRAGQCACWIRNTVADAIDAYRMLSALPELMGRVELFHARFTLGDRLEIEQRVLSRFGKQGQPAQRQGWLLIATQVVEMSIDCDFDVMVSDLAPIDALIQRAGRIHRHRRDTEGRLIQDDAPDQRGPAILHLLMPEAVSEPPADWLTQLFPRQGNVYPNHTLLWRTARLFAPGARDGWCMPEDARDLIETVYGNPDNAPASLQRNAEKAEGEDHARRSLATQSSLRFEGGYRFDNQLWLDDTVVPTRLGDETVTVWVTRWNGKRLKPWREADSAWDYSAISLRTSLLHDEVPPDSEAIRVALAALRSQLPAHGKFGRVLIVKTDEQGHWVGEGIDRSGAVRRFRYGEAQGLEVER